MNNQPSEIIFKIIDFLDILEILSCKDINTSFNNSIQKNKNLLELKNFKRQEITKRYKCEACNIFSRLHVLPAKYVMEEEARNFESRKEIEQNPIYIRVRRPAILMKNLLGIHIKKHKETYKGTKHNVTKLTIIK